MKNTKILIVDQAGQDIQLMANVLDTAGYAMIRGVATTSEAAQVCEEFRPHLVLLNVSSVEPDKVAFLQHIRESSSPETVPSVFAFSAEASKQTRRLALASGADDFLPKPLDHAEFLLRCHNLIRSRLLQQQLLKKIASLHNLHRNFNPLQNNQRYLFCTETNMPCALC